MPPQTTSQAGIQLLMEYEGSNANYNHLQATDIEGNGIPTIGYGHYGDTANFPLGTTITEPQAQALLRADLQKFESHVLQQYKGPIPLTQNQFDALVLWSFNTSGPAGDSVWTALNSGDFFEAMVQLGTWRSATISGVKTILRGLNKRRNDEIQLFMGGESQRDHNDTDHFVHQDKLQEFVTQSIASGLESGSLSAEQAHQLFEAGKRSRRLMQAYVTAVRETERKCFAPGTMVTMADNSVKAIEHVQPGDVVLSYDENGTLKPGRVTRTFKNEVPFLLDLHGLMVTPGHATYCAEGKFRGHHVPVIDILRDDGAIMRADGTNIRAATGAEVGSLDDRKVRCILTRKTKNGDRLIATGTHFLRYGTRVILDHFGDISIRELVKSQDGVLNDQGLIEFPDSDPVPFNWSAVQPMFPMPEDYVLQRSGLTLDQIYGSDPGQTDISPNASTTLRGVSECSSIGAELSSVIASGPMESKQ